MLVVIEVVSKSHVSGVCSEVALEAAISVWKNQGGPAEVAIPVVMAAKEKEEFFGQEHPLTKQPVLVADVAASLVLPFAHSPAAILLCPRIWVEKMAEECRVHATVGRVEEGDLFLARFIESSEQDQLNLRITVGGLIRISRRVVLNN